MQVGLPRWHILAAAFALAHPHCCFCVGTSSLLLLRWHILTAAAAAAAAAADWGVAPRLHCASGTIHPSPLSHCTGNDMYKLFLDASMTYSCGVWAKGALRGGWIAG